VTLSAHWPTSDHVVDERMPWGDDPERTEPILRRIEQGPPRI
jgi:hypothetical protein